LSSLTRGREYDGLTPSQYSIPSSGAVVAVQPGLPQHRGNALHDAAHQVRRVRGVVRRVHFPADSKPENSGS